MNILLVTLAYEPATAFGGTVKVVQNNARELVRRGHHVTVFCTNRLNRTERISRRTFVAWDHGVRVVYLNTWFLPRWPGNFGPTLSPVMPWYLWREGRQYDLIHINESRTSSTVMAALFARAARIPYVIQGHGSFSLGLRHHMLKRWYDRALGPTVSSGASRVLGLSQAEIDECESAGIPRHKIRIINNGIDVSSWTIEPESGKRFRRHHGIPAGCKVVLFLGRLDKKKGPDLLVMALSELQDPDVRCVFAGPDDGYGGYVRELATELRLLERIVFAGQLRGQEVMDAYAAADVFVLPCRFDTFPMSVVEACASGLPLVVTDTCQIAEKLRGRAGLVVPVDAHAIADGIGRLLDQPDLAQTLARGAREMAETEFSVRKVGEQLEILYDEVRCEFRRTLRTGIGGCR